MTMQPSRLLRLAAMLLALSVAGAALAQQTTKPAASKKSSQPAPRYGKVGNSIQHGTDTAGHGVAKADHAARSGIDKGSEAASRPVRNLGDKLGRKLGLGQASPAPPARGPQSEAP